MGGGLKRDLTVLFGLYGAKKGVLQVLNPSISPSWTRLEVVGLKMLSAGQHLALLRQNLSIIRHQIAVSEQLPTARNR